MKDFFQPLLAIFVIAPYAVTFLLFVLFKVTHHSSVKSLRIAADVTVPFLFVSVSILFSLIAGIQTNIILMIGILLIAIGFATAERVRSKDFRMKRMIRNLWRMLFLMLSILYILLLLVGVIKTIFEYLTN